MRWAALTTVVHRRQWKAKAINYERNVPSSEKANASIDFGRGTNRFSRLIIGEDLFQRD